MYDYLIVGAGLFGSVVANKLKQNGKKVFVIDKRNHIAGNLYTENIKGINVHKYGAHIFHTNNRDVWEFVNKFAAFNRYTNSPIANYKGEIFSLPFNMYTFNKMWGCITPEDAFKIIEAQKHDCGFKTPRNLEEQAISLVGVEIYEKLVKEYTEKQWGKSCKDLPSFIIKRLPVRFTYDNNYFNALYQGIPIGGYTLLVEKMLNGVDVELNTDFLNNRDYFSKIAKKIIFTGPIDSYFDYSYGALEYRSLSFVTDVLEIDNYQGNAVVNYTSREVPYTRIIEHKWFEFGKDQNGSDVSGTIITKEYSKKWSKGDEPYYPVNDENNKQLYENYLQLASKENNVIFGGRLGEYKYYDMDVVIERALSISELLIG